MTDRHFMKREILVLVEGEAAKKSHQELFSLPDALYRCVEGIIIDEVIALSPSVSGELHIAGGWETILSAAMWSGTAPAVCDVLALLKKTGMADAELSLLDDLALRDIFSLLCREESLELLRRICNVARANVESLRSGGAKVHIHIVSDETKRIVASSL
jgi:hypothetical protein